MKNSNKQKTLVLTATSRIVGIGPGGVVLTKTDVVRK